MPRPTLKVNSDIPRALRKLEAVTLEKSGIKMNLKAAPNPGRVVE